MKFAHLALGFVLCVSLSLVGRADAHADDGPAALSLGSSERLITIITTNDIHGGVEASTDKAGTKLGGMAALAGTVQSIRAGLARQYADRAGTLLLDAGDQFQGTLISNYNEGQLVFATMNEAGYDAAVPGNHDYDFGPKGWLDDQVNPQNPDKDPRGALLRLIGEAKFPLLSANTFYKSSIVEAGSGKSIAVNGDGCKPVSGTDDIDWTKAVRPSFFTPYVIKTVAGVRVALIGLDHPGTPEVTTTANVSDLCFADLVDTYQRVHEQIASQADVFVLVMHYGDINKDLSASDIVKKITALPGRPVDAVLAGHTHAVNDVLIDGVPMIQSGANGQLFGRIDLVYDVNAHQLNAAKLRKFAGVPLYLSQCDKSAASFCSVDADGKPSYEGVPLVLNSNIQTLIAQARADVAPLATRVLGDADGTISVDRVNESPMGDAMTDALRTVSGADIALMNTGGLRAPFAAGNVTYEDLFRVLPFNNHGVLVGPMSADLLLQVLTRSVQTCGSYGALMQSGLRVVYEHDCSNAAGLTDPQARLLHVETVSGQVILDVDSGVSPPSGQVYQVATLDFLVGGGFQGMTGLPIIKDIGIVREDFTNLFLGAPAHFTTETDGRLQAQQRQ